jgi:hypothetical protein
MTVLVKAGGVLKMGILKMQFICFDIHLIYKNQTPPGVIFRQNFGCVVG